MHREFVIVENPVSKLNEQEYNALLFNIQKGLLLSLEKRQLLTHLQIVRCMEELERKEQENVRKI